MSRAVAIAQPAHSASLLAPESRHFLEACAGQLALALERDRLMIEAAEARIEAETEHLRSSLLSSVSHDLRTPLAAIGGASQTLQNCSTLTAEVQQELLQSIGDEANRLSRLLENILQMSKLEAGQSRPNRQWHVLEDLVGVALQRTARLLKAHDVEVKLTAEPILIDVDGLMIEQLLVNLLENTAIHTPVGSKVKLHAQVHDAQLTLHVEDSGPGIPTPLADKIFHKFVRATASPDSVRGSGLGLAIARAIARAHQGNLTVRSSDLGGAEFVLTLPIHPQPQLPAVMDQ